MPFEKFGLKAMATELGVSSAYLSALEHGHRGRLGSVLVMQICGQLDLIWDEAEELKRLAELSHPKVTLNTAGLHPKATELANRLAQELPRLDAQGLQELEAVLDRSPKE